MQRLSFIHAVILFLLLGAAACGPGDPVPAAGPAGLEPPFDSPARIGPDEEDARPELVVLVLIDALRSDHVGAYGDHRRLTPALDRLARRACLFERTVAPSSWTRPSVASMFTSCYPGSIGVQNKEDLLAEDLLTVAEMLKVYGGFRCVGISTNAHTSRSIGFAQGFDSYHLLQEKRGYPGDFELVPAEAVTRFALRNLPQWLAPGAPLFLFLHYVDPHDPYMANPGWLSGPEPAGLFNGSRADLLRLSKQSPGKLRKEDYDRIRYLYAGEVNYCDFWVGQLLRGIERIGAGSSGETMTIVTADHGEGLWNHGQRGHGFIMHEEQVRVPLLIRYPGMGPGDGRRIGQPVSLIDIGPTILAACDIPRPAQFQGEDLAPLTRGVTRHPSRGVVYSELNLTDNNYESVLVGQRKLIRDRSLEPNSPTAFKLFDLLTDPTERDDLIATGASDRGIDELKAILRKWGAAVGNNGISAPQLRLDDMDSETRENLEALGYLTAE